MYKSIWLLQDLKNETCWKTWIVSCFLSNASPKSKSSNPPSPIVFFLIFPYTYRTIQSNLIVLVYIFEKCAVLLIKKYLKSYNFSSIKFYQLINASNNGTRRVKVFLDAIHGNKNFIEGSSRGIPLTKTSQPFIFSFPSSLSSIYAPLKSRRKKKNITLSYVVIRKRSKSGS